MGNKHIWLVTISGMSNFVTFTALVRDEFTAAFIAVSVAMTASMIHMLYVYNEANEHPQ